MDFVTVEELKERQRKFVLEAVYHRVMAHKAEILANAISEQLDDYEQHSAEIHDSSTPRSQG